MYDDVAVYLDELLDQGIAWPDAVEMACVKFDIANRELIEEVYDDWVNQAVDL